MTDKNPMMSLQETIAKYPEHRFELIWSSDDDGWYWMDWQKDETSQVFRQPVDAQNAMSRNELRFD